MQTTQVRRPLPVIHVHAVLPPGAVRRSLTGAVLSGATRGTPDHGTLPSPAEHDPLPSWRGTLPPRPGTPAPATLPSRRGHGATRAPAQRRVPARTVLVAGAAVLAAVAAGVVSLGGGDATHDPSATSRAPAPGPALIVLLAGDTPGSTGPVTVAVPLPAGLARGRVNPLAEGPAAEAEVTRLAAALGVDGRPRRTASGWSVGPDLQVSDAPGRPWTLGSDTPDRATEVPIATPTGGIPDAARATLAALGLSRAEVRYAATSGTLDVVAAPLVGELPTAGMETRLRYAGPARLAGGSGFLAPPILGGPAYPLISAEQALGTVEQGPGVARQVVGARPGLVLRRELDDRQLLMPAWFYAVEGGSALTALAVDPSYVRTR